MRNSAIRFAALGILALSVCSTAEAQRGRRNSSGAFSGMRARTQQRWDSRNQQISMRTGRPVQQVEQARVRRMEMLGAALGGVGAGLGAYSSSIGYSSPSIAPYRSSSPSIPSYQQSNWAAYNQSYSTNPWHAPANGF